MANDARFNEGDSVKWSWGNGTGKGTIQSKFEEKTTRKIDGTEVTKNGSAENPAYYVKVEDGNNVLKLGSELSAA